MPQPHTDTGPLNPFGEFSRDFHFYPSLSHRKVAHRIARGLEARCGLVLLTGEIGSGKTSVSRHLRQEYGQHLNFVVLDNPQLGPAEQAARILRDVGAPEDAGDPVDALRAHLETAEREPGATVLIFDECHLMTPQHFEQIQVLSNLRAGAVPLVQILLVGQVEIKDMLRQPGFEALNQRIGVRCELEPLSLHDTREYIAFKLRQSDYPQPDVFEEQAVERLWALSGGLPRLINHACAQALDQVTFCGLSSISPALVDEVGADPMYRDLYTVRTKRPARPRRNGAMLALGLAALLGAGIWFAATRPAPESSAPQAAVAQAPAAETATAAAPQARTATTGDTPTGIGTATQAAPGDKAMEADAGAGTTIAAAQTDISTGTPAQAPDAPTQAAHQDLPDATEAATMLPAQLADTSLAEDAATPLPDTMDSMPQTPRTDRGEAPTPQNDFEAAAPDAAVQAVQDDGSGVDRTAAEAAPSGQSSAVSFMDTAQTGEEPIAIAPDQAPPSPDSGFAEADAPAMATDASANQKRESTTSESTETTFATDAAPIAPAVPELDQGAPSPADDALDGMDLPLIANMHIDAVAWQETESQRLAVLDGNMTRPGDRIGDVQLETIGHNYLYFIHEGLRYKRLWNLSGQ